jgi:hypothetical protein
MTTMAADDNGKGGQQQRWMTKAVDDDAMLDWAADYEGEGGERAAKALGMRLISPPGKEN